VENDGFGTLGTKLLYDPMNTPSMLPSPTFRNNLRQFSATLYHNVKSACLVDLRHWSALIQDEESSEFLYSGPDIVIGE